MRHLDLKKLCPGGENILKCIPGARIGTIRRIIRNLAAKYEADHIIIVVGANHHHENSAVLATKVKFLLKEAKELFGESKIHYSAYLPKFSDDWVPFILDFNAKMKKICWGIGVDPVWNDQFIVNGAADQTLIARDGLHLSRKGVATLATNFKNRLRFFKVKGHKEWKMKPGRLVTGSVEPSTDEPEPTGVIGGFQNVVDGRFVATTAGKSIEKGTDDDSDVILSAHLQAHPTE